MDKARILEIAAECLRQESAAIGSLIPTLGDDFLKVVEMISNCKGKIVLSGVGKSGHCARKIAATFASTGTPSFFVNPLDVYHGDLGMISKQDIFVAISYSGNTFELVRFLPRLQAMGVPVIGITSSKDSVLGKFSVCCLNIYVEREADPLGLVPTSSTTVTLALGDALTSALMAMKQFRNSDFARLHPGGRIGKLLNFKVADLMMKENLPLVRPEDTLVDSLGVMTKGRKGVLIVVSEAGSVMGIITDGDLRRAMQKYRGDFSSVKVKDAMTVSPVTVTAEEKISKALDLFVKHSIHSLIVIDGERMPIGIIDSFACM
ncbi:MAG: KpsF/GutQ family sugar-phosphate isomerase [Bacteroidales bacterium]|nr:KpsF/GutQ family sugar-phosphate isomerase [Bacteroidales bacterium]